MRILKLEAYLQENVIVCSQFTCIIFSYRNALTLRELRTYIHRRCTFIFTWLSNGEHWTRYFERTCPWMMQDIFQSSTCSNIKQYLTIAQVLNSEEVTASSFSCYLEVVVTWQMREVTFSITPGPARGCEIFPTTTENHTYLYTFMWSG